MPGNKTNAFFSSRTAGTGLFSNPIFTAHNSARFARLSFRWLVLIVLLSLAIGSLSAGFLFTLAWVTRFREAHVWIIALLPVGGLLSGLLYQYYGKDVSGGNNQLIQVIQRPRKEPAVPLKMALLVYIGTLITHLLGGSAGREGTALQMAGSAGDNIGRLFGVRGRDRALLMVAAIAGGFGAVFGTPLAGAVFALEIAVIGRISYASIFPAFLVAILSDYVCRMYPVQHAHYVIGAIPSLGPVTLLWVLIAGILCGAVAWCFSNGLVVVSRLFSHTFAYPPFRTALGGIIVAACIWISGTTDFAGLGVPVIQKAFGTPLPAYDFASKLLLTVLTLSCGFKGGEVTPLFFIGATFGNALACFMPLPTGLLAGIGFTAVFAGATNTPIACTLMGIELFGSECGIYIALGCITAYIFSGSQGIYSKQSRGVGKPFHFLNRLR